MADHVLVHLIALQATVLLVQLVKAVIVLQFFVAVLFLVNLLTVHPLPTI